MNIYNIQEDLKDGESRELGEQDKVCDEEGDSKNSIEEKFVSELCGKICEIMNINWKDRELFKSLLHNSLTHCLNNRDTHSNLGRGTGLLQQYLAHELDSISKSIKHKLNIPDDVKVNHKHGVYGKFNDIVRYIKDNYYTNAANVLNDIEKNSEPSKTSDNLKKQ